MSVLDGFEAVGEKTTTNKMTMTVMESSVRFSKGVTEALGCPAYVKLLVNDKQKTAYEMESRDWSSDVCSSDLRAAAVW